MDRGAVERWVDGYERAWRTPGTELLAELFSPDVSYLPSPWAHPIIGLSRARPLWDAEREGPDEPFTMTSDVETVDGDTARSRRMGARRLIDMLDEYLTHSSPADRYLGSIRATQCGDDGARGQTMNSLFEEEIRGHHSMRDHLLTLVSDDDLAYKLPGKNPTLGELLVEMGDLQGAYTHSFETSTLDWAHRQLPPPATLTAASLRAWFDAQDDAMKGALNRFTDDELHLDRIDRGGGFIASPFVQHQVYREAVYIFYGKLSVYLSALERDAGQDWAAWVG